MQSRRAWMRLAATYIVSWLLVVGLACSAHDHESPWLAASAPDPGGPAKGSLTALPSPPLSDGVFPCSDCHANLDTDFTPRVLEDHEIDLRHGDRERWCFDCHDPGDRDQLRLASGTLVPLDESHRLCGQCHGDKHRDWRRGVHGKRIGSWDGARQYQVCVACHDSHAPSIRPIAPMPPPPRPARVGMNP
jgi:hypothetical protein